MIIYPAIDLRQGKCVRLLQGEKKQEIVYHNDPVRVAEDFVLQGAQWLHMIDLDRAFGEDEHNLEIIKTVAARFPQLRIQCGGGIRSLDDIDELLQAGIARVILGTMAIREPKFTRSAAEQFGPQAVAVAIDARDGRVAVEGWTRTSEIEATALLDRLQDDGIQLAIYTDISRDGMMSGVNLAALKELLTKNTLKIIASGGIHQMSDLEELQQLNNPQLDGAILGRSLYEGKIDLRLAIQKYSDSYAG